MKLIKEASFKEMDFVWISSHYDMHLLGTCTYNNKLCVFKGELPDYNDEDDEWEDEVYRIYSLSKLEKLRWKWKQWKFEQCVGYHWTYGEKRKDFYYRNPQWFYKMLFQLYF